MGLAADDPLRSPETFPNMVDGGPCSVARTFSHDSANDGPLRLPVELHKAWLQYLSQPELLRVGAVSRSWRALALDEPEFYLAVFLQTIRGRRQKTFVQHLNYATCRKLPIGIILDFPFSPNKTSCDILANNVFPAIKRAMPYVRKLAIVCASPLPASSLASLQAPALSLREFVYKLDPEYDPYEEDWDSDDGGSDYGDDDDDYYDYCREPPAQTTRPLPPRLFAGTAPKLTTIDLYAVPLPDTPVAAFSRVTHITLGDFQPLPSLGLGAHFPAAKHLDFTLEEERLDVLTTCARAFWLPAGLASLDVHVSSAVLRALCELADLGAVAHLRVEFDVQYESEDYPTYSFNASVGRAHVRDAAWAACLAHLAPPRSVAISCTPRDPEGQPEDVCVAFSDAAGARSVTFYAGEVFAEELACDGEPYRPLSSLICVAADLVRLSVCDAHMHAVFHIDKTLPALREITVTLSGGRRAPFVWDEQRNVGIACPALERLVLSCDALPRGAEIASHELAQFARALGLSDSAAVRPRLVLRGVSVARGEGHAAFFAL